MTHTCEIKRMLTLLVFVLLAVAGAAQSDLRWSADGGSYYHIESNEIVQYSLPTNAKTTIVSQAAITPQGQEKPLAIRTFYFSADQQRVLIYTNSKRVWRLDTQGDYWVLEIKSKKLRKLGLSQPESSLRFAKFSPDGLKVAYVSENDLFVEDLVSGRIKMLTVNRSRKLINGTFDWTYEEEFSCRDGFQWAPDGQQIAFWQIDATKIPDYNMVNMVDSVYSKIVPVEYPTVGQTPSSARIGIANVVTGKVLWLSIPGDPQQHYLPRLEWVNAREVLVQQLNRRQSESIIFQCDVSGACKSVFQEKETTWIDVSSPWESPWAIDFRHRFNWLSSGLEFLWASEKDGWRHLYRVSRNTGKDVLITKGDYDVMEVKWIDEKNNQVYFLASPDNATQKYLYKTTLDGKGKLEKVTPLTQKGTHNYGIAPGGKYAHHSFSNSYTRQMNEVISLSDHNPLFQNESIESKTESAQEEKAVEFFTLKTAEGVDMDGWVVKPKDFDPKKKYPVIFYVYTEPAAQTVTDSYGAGKNPLFTGDMRQEGYIYVSVDNRGTPAPKGAAWRKSIYRNIGRLNISDQAAAAREVLKWPYVDRERVAVWGWSGGGSATLNLLFQYPDIYKAGVAVAAVTNLLTYDNIYEERYMGLLPESRSDYIDGSPIKHVKNFNGKLLYIHGTGDDNVHYNNAEMLLNEMIKHNKQFEFMAYPNRTHSISEGVGTSEHLATLFTAFMRKNCPPGAR